MELAGGEHGATKIFSGALAPTSRRVLCAAVLCLALIALSAGRAVAEQGLASWYGPGFEGQPTASGEPFDKYDFTCAHQTLPLGTVLNVAYEGRSTRCRVNDRGPYSGNRELDLSQGTAEYLGLDEVGVDVIGYSVTGDSASDEVPDGASAQSKDVVLSETSENAKSSGAGEYVVRPGDTLSEIADTLGTSSDILASLNGIADPDILLEGQVLQTAETRGGPHTSQPTEPPSGDASDASVIKEVAGTTGAEPVAEEVRQGFPVDPGAVAGRHLDPGVETQPVREALPGALGQQVHHEASLEVDKYGPVGVAFPEGEVVDPEDRHGSGGGSRGMSEPVEQGVGAHQQAKSPGEACPGLAALLERDREHRLLQAGGLPGPRGDLLRPFAPFPVAEKPAHGAPASPLPPPGQVGDGPDVTAANALGMGAARRVTGEARVGPGEQGELPRPRRQSQHRDTSRQQTGGWR